MLPQARSFAVHTACSCWPRSVLQWPWIVFTRADVKTTSAMLASSSLARGRKWQQSRALLRVQVAVCTHWICPMSAGPAVVACRGPQHLCVARPLCASRPLIARRGLVVRNAAGVAHPGEVRSQRAISPFVHPCMHAQSPSDVMHQRPALRPLAPNLCCTAVCRRPMTRVTSVGP